MSEQGRMDRWASLPRRIGSEEPFTVAALAWFAGTIFLLASFPDASLVGAVIGGGFVAFLLAFAVAFAYLAVLAIVGIVWFVIAELVKAARDTFRSSRRAEQ